MSKLSDTDWIPELEDPFSGRAISSISLRLVKNSKINDTYSDLRAVNTTQFLGFGKD
jgi:hypothetical protein